ncbi:Phosphoribosylaminoimidazole-succinocarboxamide synthase OS=Pichia angusta GN=ADE1 PE=3 SV=1 [Rhizoctonia solani AG-1 IB]|uniref:Phosphoribosylaminoimidazole-succinocarboxamide synthase n=1 Tax=Thanatephorus cucumeris (strain AG1-IB / isolate 7/3/14) TaxID=1108050 RepID=A0A0B7FJQ5_THACB|nr:Phosphoribosylaminoimidazole-succinocarboxamide synthase OS=Pichia angusta GN=ADE1 PE=3 SV=1 [Rhizoctonia solani AG-1 IB]
MAITTTKELLPELTLVSQGKVRDIYCTSDPSALLFVATDRISAYDGVPGKGVILSQLALFWFKKLEGIIPNHLITDNVDQMPPEVAQYKDVLQGRTMLVKKAKVIPLEAIVRGYITGSAWSEYKKSGTVHGIPVPEGLVESQKLPEPLFTPSTKAEQGQHDENIHPDRGRVAVSFYFTSNLTNPFKAAEIVGKELCDKIASVSVRIYKEAAEYAASRGVILADTKLEFGLVEVPGNDPQLILIDEVLTPDSSRYWPASEYKLGK